MKEENPYTKLVDPLGDPLGKCHICAQVVPIRFCPKCNHWFCLTCRRKWFERGYGAVMEIVRGRQPGCCGLLEET